MFKQEINRKRIFPTNRRFVPKMKKALRAMYRSVKQSRNPIEDQWVNRLAEINPIEEKNLKDEKSE